MNRNAKKNHMMFLGGTIVAAIVVFVSAGFLLIPQPAHAYAVGALPTSTGSTSGSYNIDNSFQNLISPFTGFINSLKLNNDTSINTAGQTQEFPTVNLAPAVSTGAQNILSQWLSQFDNWFYGISGIHLSGIFQVILSVIAWTLGLAQQVVNWLLGLFH